MSTAKNQNLYCCSEKIRKLIGLSDEAAQQISQRYQIETFLKGMLEVRAALEAKRRLWSFRATGVQYPSEYGVEQMVTFQQVSDAVRTHFPKFFDLSCLFYILLFCSKYPNSMWLDFHVFFPFRYLLAHLCSASMASFNQMQWRCFMTFWSTWEQKTTSSSHAQRRFISPTKS